MEDRSSGAPVVATLLVKHLPAALQADTLQSLFAHFRATDVRICKAARLRGCAFVDFKDEADANRAQGQLNRLRLLNKVLAVEHARPLQTEQRTPQEQQLAPPGTALSAPQPPPALPEKQQPPPLPGPQAGLEPIAPNLGVEYPFPPHLTYAYPPPDSNILTNILNTLAAVPRFYTQVLHLMNKMNLPPPFGPATPTPPLPAPPASPPPEAHRAADASSSESELEDEETGAARQGVKRKAREEGEPDRSGVRQVTLVPKKGFKELVKPRKPVMQFKLGTPAEAKAPPAVPPSPGAEAAATQRQALLEEIAGNRTPPDEILAMPMFKKYAPGPPARVLYVKNLAKDVAVADLLSLFGAFLAAPEKAAEVLGVRLMQEGRMKGQAFVTFPAVEVATAALEHVHGYNLKGKPMIVQYGRNPTAATAPAVQTVQATGHPNEEVQKAQDAELPEQKQTKL